jgi:hypothetical protein
MRQKDLKMNEGDYIVRVWPSGIITMGCAMARENRNTRHLCFYSLETYTLEGGVELNRSYGFFSGIRGYQHRLATKIELEVFQKYGKLQMTPEEIISIHRDYQLNELLK